MNARPYIFGWLCLVGAIGTAAASDARMTSNLLSLGRSVVSSSFDAGSSSRSGQDSGQDSGRDSAADTSRPFHGVPGTRGQGQIPMSPPVDADARDGSSGGRSSGPSWQSMLPGSIF